MTTVFALLLVLFGGFGLVKLLGHWRRRSGRALLGAAPVRQAQAVDLRAVLFRTSGFLGLEPGRSHPARADLLLSTDRLVVPSDLGVLVDTGGDPPSTLHSARCTGPSRLVLEGEVGERGPAPGRFRLEVVVEEAEAWAEALAPLVRAEADAPAFGSLRPKP